MKYYNFFVLTKRIRKKICIYTLIKDKVQIENAYMKIIK